MTAPGPADVVVRYERELDSYRRELYESGLLQHLQDARAAFEASVTGTTRLGHPYGFGAIDIAGCEGVFALVRTLRPEIVVETGVCNGVSTAVILLALDTNREGRLYSLDLPEHAGTEYPQGTFWPGKKGAAVPVDREPGWVVPARLRDRWELSLGRSQDVLPGLLERLRTIDLFLHDSEHSYECMNFEFRLAYTYLRSGGILLADDFRWNAAFDEFAVEQSHRTYELGRSMSFLVK